MSSGLIALLDDVALIAKTASASVDDVAAMSAKAGSKAAGVVIDDAAVTPRYVMGFSPARELPIVMKIARGSLFNKLVILLPAALLLSQFAPWAIPPLLMCGGLFLCFEGAEKVMELFHHADPEPAGIAAVSDPQDPAGTAAKPVDLEDVRVASAVRTDLILSAEIMAITLAALPMDSPLWERGLVLALVAVAITVGVYGAVALIVKADDIGLAMARGRRISPLSGGRQALGRGIVKAMPWVLFALSKIGMVAMLWVGGGILLHGAEVLGWHAPADAAHHLAHVLGGGMAAAEWVAGALISAALGLLVGLGLVPLVHRLPFGGH